MDIIESIFVRRLCTKSAMCQAETDSYSIIERSPSKGTSLEQHAIQYSTHGKGSRKNRKRGQILREHLSPGATHIQLSQDSKTIHHSQHNSPDKQGCVVYRRRYIIHETFKSYFCVSMEWRYKEQGDRTRSLVAPQYSVRRDPTRSRRAYAKRELKNS